MGAIDEGLTAIPSAPRGLSLRRNFVWTVVGNVTYAACQWGMLMALAKLGSPEMVGQFALGLAIGGPVMMLANVQLRAVIATDVLGEYRFGDYLSLRLLATGLALVVISAVVVVAGYRPETAWVVLLVGLAKSVESVSDVIYGVLQKHERLDRIAVALMLRGIGSVTLFAAAIWMTGNIGWAVGALVSWWSIVLIAYEWKTGAALHKSVGMGNEKFAPAWNWPRLRRLASLSFPLGLVMVLASLGMNIPRYFVEHELGEAALGYFAALAYVMVAGYTVMNALGQSASTRLARYFNANRTAYVRLLWKMMGVALALGLGAIFLAVVWGRLVLRILYRPDYATYQPLFVWLMVAAALYYIGAVLGHGMTAARIFRPQVPLYAASSLGILIVCWFGTGTYGLLAAAWSLAAGGGIAAAGSAIVLLSGVRAAPKSPPGVAA